MGTSKSYGGPGGKPPLLPRWALGGGGSGDGGDGDGANGNGEGDGSNGNGPDGNGPSGEPPSPSSNNPQQAASGTPTLNPWTAARRAMGGFSGGGGGGQRLGNAARRYVQAKGGASRAARSAPSGRGATAALGGFLSGVATRGVADTFRALGLADAIGRPAEAVLAVIVNTIAPSGATLEEMAARRAVNETLVFLFDKYGVDERGIEQLNRLDADGVQETIKASVSSYIFQRWLGELGKKIDERAISPREAVRLERDVRNYVRDALMLDLKGRDPLRIDWAGREGRELVDRIYTEAYGFLGG